MSIYRKVKLAIGVPTSGRIVSYCTQSLIALALELKRVNLFPETEQQEFSFLFRQSSTVAANRQKIVEDAIAGGFNLVLFVDDDMHFPAHAVGILAARRLPIVGCNYRKRHPPAEFTAMGMDGKRIEIDAKSDGVIEADYMGFGLCLIDVEVFANLPKPWFRNEWDERTQTLGTEDMPFFRAARAAGIPSYVDCEASKLVGHVGEYVYRFNDDFSVKGV